MHQSLAKFSEPEASDRTPFLADFATATPELEFSIHTQGGDQNAHQEISVPRLYPETSGVQIVGDDHVRY
jgi:hypothetical protein